MGKYIPHIYVYIITHICHSLRVGLSNPCSWRGLSHLILVFGVPKVLLGFLRGNNFILIIHQDLTFISTYIWQNWDALTHYYITPPYTDKCTWHPITWVIIWYFFHTELTNKFAELQNLIATYFTTWISLFMSQFGSLIYVDINVW